MKFVSMRLALEQTLFLLPCDAHHHSDDDGDLHGADDGGDEDVVQLLSTGNHIEDVEVLRLVTLRTFVAGVTSADYRTSLG